MKIGLEIEGKRIELEDKLELELFNINTKEIEEGKFYKFNIKGWKIFPFQKPIPLFVKDDSYIIASIDIIEQTAFLLGGLINTKGEYYVRKLNKL